MNLDFLENINESGDNIIRLYNFNFLEAKYFKLELEGLMLRNIKFLELEKLDFIQSNNCNLTLRVSEWDKGIMTADRKNFFCDLSLKGYSSMQLLVAPFCEKNIKGHQYLYDIETEIDFLFSPSGEW